MDLTTFIEHLVEQKRGGDDNKVRDEEGVRHSVPAWILSPESGRYTLWSTIQAFVVFWIYMELPYRLAFYDNSAVFWYTEIATWMVDVLLYVRSTQKITKTSFASILRV